MLLLMLAQVWLGALLLCDFMLHYSVLLKGAVVVDLGAGVGLTSIVAAIMAKTVFCTGVSYFYLCVCVCVCVCAQLDVCA